MDSSWIDLWLAWAGRNPIPLSLLFGSVALTVLAAAIRRAPEKAEAAPEVATAAAPAPELEKRDADELTVIAPVAPSLDETEPIEALEDTELIEVLTRTERVDVRTEPTEAVEPVEPIEPTVPLAPPARLRDRLRLTRESLSGRLGKLLGGRIVDADVLEELEMLLFEADLGVKTADSLLERVRSEAGGRDGTAVREVLRGAIVEKLARVESVDALAVRAKPHVVLVLGVNGSGKTTSIGKLAARYRGAGHKVILGAGDTYRAAAIEQLQAWGERAGCEVIAGQAGGDPSAVAYDTVAAAKARDCDVAIIDTAGRLQTKRPLMEELGKMVRVIGKDLDGAPHEVLLVLDSTTGQNAISQARLFTEVAGVTGLVLTKLDGTAKGGVIIGLADEFGIPVQYVGVGEGVEDLRDFSAADFVDAIFDDGDGATDA